MRRTLTQCTVTAALLTLALPALPALAQHGDGLGSATRSVCVHRRTGALRLLAAPSDRCRRREERLDWALTPPPAVEAGDGLVAADEDGVLRVEVDRETIQSRVVGSCPEGQALQSIAADGSVTCTPCTCDAPELPPEIPLPPRGPEVYSGYLEEVRMDYAEFPGALITQLHLPAGEYSIWAKLDVAGHVNASGVVGCRLHAGGDSDTSNTTAWYQSSTHGYGNVPVFTPRPLALNVVHDFPVGGSAILQCYTTAIRPSDGWPYEVFLRHIKITAVKAGALSNLPLQPM